mmetsp:Transcript_18975/g.35417  ORF Transcript_18975/g.35417 Transcript_18975/m.35417 type:complete len:193 (-) Transcript_18975:177-755(-)
MTRTFCSWMVHLLVFVRRQHVTTPTRQRCHYPPSACIICWEPSAISALITTKKVPIRAMQNEFVKKNLAQTCVEILERGGQEDGSDEEKKETTQFVLYLLRASVTALFKSDLSEIDFAIVLKHCVSSMRRFKDSVEIQNNSYLIIQNAHHVTKSNDMLTVGVVSTLAECIVESAACPASLKKSARQLIKSIL